MEKIRKITYHDIATELRKGIESKIFTARERLPSVRALASNFNVSPTTVLRAYYQLEKEGLVHSSDRRGFYIIGQLTRPIDLKQKLSPGEPRKADASAPELRAIDRQIIRSLAGCLKIAQRPNGDAVYERCSDPELPLARRIAFLACNSISEIQESQYSMHPSATDALRACVTRISPICDPALTKEGNYSASRNILARSSLTPLLPSGSYWAHEQCLVVSAAEFWETALTLPKVSLQRLKECLNQVTVIEYDPLGERWTNPDRLTPMARRLRTTITAYVTSVEGPIWGKPSLGVCWTKYPIKMTEELDGSPITSLLWLRTLEIAVSDRRFRNLLAKKRQLESDALNYHSPPHDDRHSICANRIVHNHSPQIDTSHLPTKRILPPQSPCFDRGALSSPARSEN